jgi:hypothetical protein
MPGSRFYATTGQSIPNNTATNVLFNSPMMDELGLLPSGSPFSDFTILQEGTYLIAAGAGFGTGATGYRELQIELQLPTVPYTTATLSAQWLLALGGGTVRKSVNISTTAHLVPGTIVRLVALQTNGTAVTLDLASTGTPNPYIAFFLIT